MKNRSSLVLKFVRYSVFTKEIFVRFLSVLHTCFIMLNTRSHEVLETGMERNVTIFFNLGQAFLSFNFVKNEMWLHITQKSQLIVQFVIIWINIFRKKPEKLFHSRGREVNHYYRSLPGNPGGLATLFR